MSAPVQTEHLQCRGQLEDRGLLADPGVQGALGPPGRVLGVAGDPVGDRQRPVEHLAVGHAHAHEPEPFGLPAGERVAGEQVVARLRQAHVERPQQHRVIAGHHAPAQVPVVQLHVLAHDADVGRQRNREPGRHGQAVHRRDGRLAALDHPVHERAHLVHRLVDVGAARVVTAAEAADLATGAERLTGSGDHRNGDPLVAIDVAPHVPELDVEPRVDGVPTVRSVDRDDQHATVTLIEEQVLVTLEPVHSRRHSRPFDCPGASSTA